MNANNGLIFKVLSTGRDSLGLNLAQKMVLLVLLEHWNPSTSGAMCWPGQERIADHGCMSLRSVRDALQVLQDCGYIKIRLVPGHSNRYQIESSIISAALDAALPRQELPVTPATVAGHPGKSCLRTPYRTPYDNSVRHSPAASRNLGQREMPLLGDVAKNALTKRKA